MKRTSKTLQHSINRYGKEQILREMEELGVTKVARIYKTGVSTLYESVGRPRGMTIPVLKKSKGDTLAGCAHRDLIGKIFSPEDIARSAKSDWKKSQGVGVEVII